MFLIPKKKSSDILPGSESSAQPVEASLRPSPHTAAAEAFDMRVERQLTFSTLGLVALGCPLCFVQYGYAVSPSLLPFGDSDILYTLNLGLHLPPKSNVEPSASIQFGLMQLNCPRAL